MNFRSLSIKTFCYWERCILRLKGTCPFSDLAILPLSKSIHPQRKQECSESSARNECTLLVAVNFSSPSIAGLKHVGLKILNDNQEVIKFYVASDVYPLLCRFSQYNLMKEVFEANMKFAYIVYINNHKYSQ